MPKRPPKSSRSPKSKRKRAAAADTLATGTDALTALRGRIDAVDAEIQRLIAERAQFAKEIGIVKGLTSTVEYYRPEREAQVLRKVVERNDGPLRDEEMVRLFRELMSACLAQEEPLKVAYLGPEGTFTQSAVFKHFGHSVHALAVPTIDEGIREIVARMIQHVRDIDVLRREAREDLRHHVGHVPVRNGHTVRPRSLEHGLGKVHRASDVAVLEELAHVIDHHDGAVFFGLECRSSEMRQADDLRVIEQRALGKIRDVGEQLAGVQRRKHGLRVDDRVAREVQDHGTAAHGFEASAVDELVGGLVQRHMHRDDVRACK